MKIVCGIVICIAFVTTVAPGQGVQLFLTVSDGDTTGTLTFGLDPGATDGIDGALQEVEQPPSPPATVFDARFIGTDISLSLGEGILKDLRAGTSSSTVVSVHELKYQIGEGTTITIGWDLPADVTGRIQDVVTGNLISVYISGTGSFVVPDPVAHAKLKVTVNYRPARVALKAFLQGPVSGGVMSTALQSAGRLPLTHPYAGSPWSHGGTESVMRVPTGVVDWVLVELRTGTASGTKVAARTAYLKNDGLLVELDSVSALAFPGIETGSYYIVLRHRDHLAIMSAGAVTLSTTASLYDFTTAASTAYGVDAMKGMGTGGTAPFALYGGEANGDGQVTSSDFNVFLPKFTSGATGYELSDWNLDGQVTSSDFNIFLANFTGGKATRVP